MSKVYREPVAKKKNNWVQYVLGALLMVVILAVTLFYILKDAPLETIKDMLFNADLRYVGLGFAFMMIHQLSVTEILRVMLKALLRVNPPWLVCYNTSFIGFYFNNITPSSTGGQPMEIYYLYRCRVDIANSSSIFMAMTLFTNFSLIVIATLGLGFFGHLILPNLYGLKYILGFGYAFNGGMMLLMLALIYFPGPLRRFSHFILNKLLKWRWLRSAEIKRARLDQFFDRYSTSAATLLRSPLLLLRLLILHLIQQLAIVSVPYAAARALGATPDFYLPSVAIQATLSLSTAGFPSPGAVGLTESAFLKMFASALTKEQLLPTMLLTRVINLYAFILLAALITLFAFLTAGRSGFRMRSLQKSKEYVLPENTETTD